jgi:hypothetical protein
MTFGINDAADFGDEEELDCRFVAASACVLRKISLDVFSTPCSASKM